MYDIAIIGAGPAGSTLARLLGSRYRVLLIEKKGRDTAPGGASAPKCCGGLLAPDAQKMLARMELGLPRDVLVGPQLFAVRTIDIPNRLERYYQRSYLNIDRGRFDQWLLSLVPPGVEVRQNCLLTSLEQDDAGVTLSLVRNGERVRERAAIVVGADGAFSPVRSHLFSDHPSLRAYVAIQEWFPANGVLPYFTAVFDPEITDFYSWIIPKNDMIVLGSALTPGPDAKAGFARLKSRLQDRGFAFGIPARREGTLLLRPLASSSILHGRGRAALIGEAGGWISPSSAEGISYAFRSALALARALDQGTEGFLRRYAEYTRPLRMNILLKNLKSPFMYRSLLRSAIMRSGLKSISIARHEDGPI